jgi:hypothetical protein
MDSKIIWEQTEVPGNIPIYNIEFPITGTELCLNVRGDQHIGLACVDVDEVVRVLMHEQNKYKDNMFVLDTGDLTENALKSSVGHNYDMLLNDPEKQIKAALAMQDKLDRNLYGEALFNRMPACTRTRTKHARRLGVLGNHEYRTRKESGIWLNKRLYGGKGVIDGGVQCIINLKIMNKKLKMSKTYRIYIAHRLTNSAAGIKMETMMANFRKKKADIPADIYVCGHYHRRFINPDYKYDTKGQKQKVLYVSNPSPADVTEYGLWGLYSPAGAGYHINVFLPIDPNEHAWGKV